MFASVRLLSLAEYKVYVASPIATASALLLATAASATDVTHTLACRHLTFGVRHNTPSPGTLVSTKSALLKQSPSPNSL